MGPRLRAALVLLFVFALGIVAGTVIERHRSTRPWGELPRAEVHQAAMAELRKELELDEEQVEQIRAIMAKHHSVVQRSWEELRPEVQSAMRQAHIEIAELLRPDQRERFHEWLMRRRERSQAREK